MFIFPFSNPSPSAVSEKIKIFNRQIDLTDVNMPLQEHTFLSYNLTIISSKHSLWYSLFPVDFNKEKYYKIPNYSAIYSLLTLLWYSVYAHTQWNLEAR